LDAALVVLRFSRIGDLSGCSIDGPDDALEGDEDETKDLEDNDAEDPPY